MFFDRASAASQTFCRMMQQAKQDGQVTGFLPEYLAHRISGRPELLAKLLPGNHIDDIKAIDAILDSAAGHERYEARKAVLAKAYTFVKDPVNAPKLCGAAYFQRAASALVTLTVDQAVSLTSRMEHLRQTVDIHLHVGFPLFDDPEDGSPAAASQEAAPAHELCAGH